MMSPTCTPMRNRILLIGRSISVLPRYGILHFDGTLHGVHNAGEIGKHAIASRIEDPTPMRGNEPVDDDPIGGEGAESADLILAMRRLYPSTSAAKIAESETAAVALV